MRHYRHEQNALLVSKSVLVEGFKGDNKWSINPTYTYSGFTSDLLSLCGWISLTRDAAKKSLNMQSVLTSLCMYICTYLSVPVSTCAIFLLVCFCFVPLSASRSADSAISYKRIWTGEVV